MGVVLEGSIQNRRLLREAGPDMVAGGVIHPCTLQHTILCASAMCTSPSSKALMRFVMHDRPAFALMVPCMLKGGALMRRVHVLCCNSSEENKPARLTPSQEEQSRRLLEAEKLSDETPSDGGCSNGLPRAPPGVFIFDRYWLQTTGMAVLRAGYITVRLYVPLCPLKILMDGLLIGNVNA